MDSKILATRIEGELGSTGSGKSQPRAGPPPRVADHELVRRIGAGSYGEVWLARSVTGQWRAVKVIVRADFTSERPYDREFRGILQFEPISRTHAGLVHVLHVGRDEAGGSFHYVMELADPVKGTAPVAETKSPVEQSPVERVAGAPSRPDGGAVSKESRPSDDPAELAPPTELVVKPPPFSPADYQPRTLASDFKSRGRLAVAEVIALGVELTGALGHIHRHGLVHRDVKPSNVIFVDGQPKLADLGLVAVAKEARSFVGTEGFIPPEGPGSVKADLFALGRLLYEAATGKDRCDFPELPEDLDTAPDREQMLELNEILSRLCAPEPADRYANAAEVAGDLNLILAGRSVRRANGVERRLRRATQVSAIALAVLTLAAGAVWFQAMRRREAETRAAREQSLRERAVTAEQESRQQLYSALLEQARATVRSGEMGQRVRALDVIHRAAAISNSADLRREVLAALMLPDLRFERTLPYTDDFTLRQLDPKFERIALCRGRGPVEIRSVAEDRLLATLPASTNLMCYGLEWSRDGRFVVLKRDYDAENHRGDLEVWDLSRNPRRVLLIRDAWRNARAFHPIRPHLLTGHASGLVVAWDLETGKELDRGTFDATADRLAYSPDGNRVAASYERHDAFGAWGASVHNAADGTFVSSNGFANPIASFDWDPKGRWIALSDYSGAIHLMDVRSGETQILGHHKAEAVVTTFGADGRYLITGSWGRELICWDVTARQRAFAINVDGYIGQFRGDGLAYAVLTDAGVQVHAFKRPEAHRELVHERAPRLRNAAFSPDGRWLAASSDEWMGVWDLTSNGRGAFDRDAAGARPFWTPDGKELFGTGGRNSACYRWRIQPATNALAAPVMEGLPVYTPERFNSFCVASNLVAWTSARGTRLGSLEDVAREEGPWVPTARGVNGISPDGRWLAIYGGFSRFLSVYRLPELEPVATLTNQARIAGFSFSPLGDELAIAGHGQTQFWSTKNWERTRAATNFIGLSYFGTLFQSDGRAMWLAKNLGTAGLHDAQTFEPLLPLPTGMFPIALSPDGRRLAVSVDARRLQVWDLAEVRQQLRRWGLDWSAADR
jgi:WD40 repeat protein